MVGLEEASLSQLLGGLAWRWTPPCIYVSAFLFFHLLHPVLSALAGVLMPDVVSGVGERHGTYSALHVHLPLIHLPGSTICISYLHGTLKTQLGGDCLHQAASHMLVR